jgi:hypothetical protein
MSTYYSMSLTESVKNIGTNVANLALGTVNTGLGVANKGIETVGVVADKGIETTGIVANSGLDATGKIADTGFKTTTSVVEHTGNAAAAGVHTAASIVGIVRDLTIRTEEISKNAALRQQEVEKLKNSELKKQVDVGIVKNTEGAQTEIETIKTEAENAKLKIQKDAELKNRQLILEAEHAKREIEAIDERNKITQQMNNQLKSDELQTNVQNSKESLAYGFTTDKSPYIAGSKEIIPKMLNIFQSKPSKKYFGYYIIIGVLDPKTLAFFELQPEDLSDKQPNDIKRKPNLLIYKDTDGNDVRVVFKQNYTKGYLSTRIETVLEVYDVNATTPKITGIPIFQKKSYFIDTIIPGGKSRRQNKKHKKINSRKKRQSKSIKK